MDATIMGYIGIIGYIWGLYRENGKENGSYYVIIRHNSIIGYIVLGFRDVFFKPFPKYPD